MTAQPLVAGLFSWLSGEVWRPLVAMLVGAALVVIAGWWLARRVQRQARAALGMAWMVGGVLMVLLFLLAAAVDAVAAGPGSAVERALLGWLPGLDMILPLGDVPAVGAVVYLAALVPLYAALVWLIWWSLVSGEHLGEADRAQSRRWLYALSGRGADGVLLPGFVRWFKPLTWLLVFVLGTALVQLVLAEHPPHPAAWVTAGLFVTGAFMNLRASGAAACEATPTPAEDVAEGGSGPALASVDDVLQAAAAVGQPAERRTALEAAAATDDSEAFAESHPMVRSYLTAVSSSEALQGRAPTPGHVGAGAPRVFQGRMLAEARAGRSALVVGPHGSGRTTGLALVALDAALTQCGTAIVVTSSSGDAASFARSMRAGLSRGVTPNVVSVAAGLVELAEERQAGHDAVVFVTTAEELRREVVARATLTPAFYRGLGAVLVDDLERFGAEAVTALRLALHEVRAVVREAGEGAQRDPVVVATATAVGTELGPWASDIVGEAVKVLGVTGAPLPACDVVMVRGGAEAGPGPVVAALKGLGFTVDVFDEVHATPVGEPSLAPLPCWELQPREARPAGADRPSDVPWQYRDARVLLVRRADAALALERRRPVGPRAALMVLYVVDAPWVSEGLEALIAEAEGVLGDPMASASKPLRLMPVGRTAPDVVRRHLIAAVERPRRLDWLQAVFPAEELEALFEAAGGLARLTTPVTVLEGDPPDLVERHIVRVPSAADLAKAPYWRGSPRISVVSAEDGDELFTFDAELSRVLLPARAAFVLEGHRYEIVSRSGDVLRATRRPSPEIVVPITGLAITLLSTLIPETTTTFADGTTLTLSAHRATVHETLTALERRAPVGELTSRDAESSSTAAKYETTAIHVVRVPSASAAAMCELVSTLAADVGHLVAFPAAHATGVWLSHRGPDPSGVTRWLLARVLTVTAIGTDLGTPKSST